MKRPGFLAAHQLLWVLVGWALVVPSVGFAEDESERASIVGIVNGVTEHFFNKDMEKFAELWADDATFITVTGIRANGKDEIVDMHSMADYIVDPSTRVLLDDPIVRFLDDRTAIAYSAWGGLVFSAAPNKLPVQYGYLTVVLRKTDSSWRIISATNAINPMGERPLSITPYTPELWRQFGVDRPEGLPLGEASKK